MSSQEYLFKRAAEIRERCFSYALRICHNADLAEDVAQDCWIKIHSKITQFDSRRGAFSTWIYTITRRTLVDAMKRNSFYREVDEGLSDMIFGVAPDNILEDMIRTESSKQVKDALLILPEHKRRILQMAFVDSMSYQAISENLSIPRGTVKSRISAAKRGLRKQLIGFNTAA